MSYADLHVHSTFSDGSLTPEQLVARAVKNGVSLLAIADHNVIAGSLAAAAPARDAGVRLIPAVEIDSFDGIEDIHMLCYAADFQNAALMEVIRDSRRRMDKMSDDLLLRMQPDYPCLDLREYAAFSFDPALGGWKMLQYLLHKGVTHTLGEGAGFYPQYDVTYANAGFCPSGEVIRVIHGAGGRAVLAHPGEVIPFESDAQFLARLDSFAAWGLDGVECYYPLHSPHITQLCLDFCRARGLMTTAGSDCHGDFGRAPVDVGHTRTPVSELRLNGLI